MEVIFVSIGSHFVRFSIWTCRPGADLDVVSFAEDTPPDERTADDAALHVPPVAAGFVDVERPCDEQQRVDLRVAVGLRDGLVERLDQDTDIDSFLRGDRYDGRVLGDGALMNRLICL